MLSSALTGREGSNREVAIVAIEDLRVMMESILVDMPSSLDRVLCLLMLGNDEKALDVATRLEETAKKRTSFIVAMNSVGTEAAI